MPSRTSLLKGELLKLILRSSGWVSIVYFLGLLFSIPFEILVTTSNENLLFVPKNVFQYNLEIQYVFLVTVPVILPLFLFHFMQSKQSSDLIHGLPIKRETIFHQYTIAGWVLLNIPVMFIAVILLFQRTVMDLGSIIEINSIFYWLGMTILFNSIIYISTVFIGMVTGISIVQGILSYVFLLLPVGLFMLSTFNLKFFMFGFPSDYLLSGKIQYLSPLTMIEGIQKIPSTLPLWIYAGISVVLYVLSLILYKKRKLESVSQAVVFPILRPVLKFGMTVCCALLVAAYFGSYRDQSEGWLYFGYLFGSFVGYLLAEMLLHKTWRVFAYVKGYLYYGGIFVVMITLFHLDITNYEDRIPEVSEIERVHLSDGPYMYLHPDDYSIETFYLEDEANIQLVHDLHKEIIENKNTKGNGNRNETAFFVYELKNGKKLVREYEIKKKDYLAYYKPIHESKEYKVVTYPLFHVNTNEIKTITVEAMGLKNDRAVISEKADLEEFMTILKEEILASTYDEMYSSKAFQSNIAFSLTTEKDNYGYANVQALHSYKKLQKWLADRDLLDNAFLSEKDIDYAVVLNKEDLNVNRDGYSHFELFEDIKSHPNAKTFEAKSEIKEMMDVTEDAYLPESRKTYVVAYKIPGQYEPYIGVFDQSEAPSFVNNKFK